MEVTEEKKQEFNPQHQLMRWQRLNSPNILFERLKKRVLGQDEELRKAAILISGYIHSMIHSQTNNRLHFLVEGKSGCGKTTFANALRELLPCPVITMDASQLTPSGYRGADVGDFVSHEELEKWWGCGVIVLDELDKLMEPVDSTNGNFHREAIENLLKMLDGGTIIGREGKSINCERMLIIGMGAFTQLKHSLEKKPIGFSSTMTPVAAVESDGELSKEAMTAFCGSEQFLGRFITVLHFQPLGRELYRQIVIQTKLEIFRIFGEWYLPAEEENRIIDQALTSEFGCRSVKAAVWEAFLGMDTVIRKQPGTLEESENIFRTQDGFYPCA